MGDFISEEGLLVVFIIAVLVALAAVAIKDREEWEKFKVAHHCKVVAHIDGEVFTTFSVNDKGGISPGIGSTSSKTGWLCDDGVTYYK